MSIPYNLPTGKTIYITMDQFLNMDHLQEQKFIANDAGYFVNNPFFNSSLDSFEEEIVDFIDPTDLLSIELPDLSDVEDIELDEEVD